MKRELARLAALSGHDVHIVVAGPIRRKCDPGAVRREAGVDVAGPVVGESLDPGAVFVCHPDVAQIAEGDLALRVRGIAEQLCLRGSESREQQQNSRQKGLGDHSSLRALWYDAAAGRASSAGG